MRYSKDKLKTCEEVGRLYNLNDRFLHEIRTLSQADVLEHIQDYCRGDWHDNYIAAQNHISKNPGREHKVMMDGLSDLLYELEKNYTHTEGESIKHLKELQERLSQGEKGILRPKDILDRHSSEVSRWMKLSGFSNTKIDELLPTIRDMIKTGI